MYEYTPQRSKAIAMRARRRPLSSLLAHREHGACRELKSVASAARALRLGAVALSNDVELATVHSGELLALSLDHSESRYLLSAAADGAIALYDTSTTGCSAPLAFVDRNNNEDAHRHAVTCVQWFPQDTGLFATSGFDGVVKLWDTNQMQVACDFTLTGRIHCLAMSSAATTHTLIATCGDFGPAIALCDPSSGSATHRLEGHRSPAWALAWSPRHEHELVTGGADRSVRVWDIRRSGSCLRSLDMHDSTGERRRVSEFRDVPAVDSTTVAAADRKLSKTAAHGGAVTSIAFTPEYVHAIARRSLTGSPSTRLDSTRLDSDALLQAPCGNPPPPLRPTPHPLLFSSTPPPLSTSAPQHLHPSAPPPLSPSIPRPRCSQRPAAADRRS